MKKEDLLNHPSFPGAQPFNIKGRCGTKRNSWWHTTSSTYWRMKPKDQDGKKGKKGKKGE